MPCAHASAGDHHGHSHGDGEEQAALLSALTGQGDKGSVVTLIGLGSNVGLSPPTSTLTEKCSSDLTISLSRIDGELRSP